jgi:hypothetical protein
MSAEPVQEGDASSLVGRRAAARARIALPATLETIGGIQPATLINLSVMGAMVEVANVPSVGGDAILRSGNIDALAVVIWAGGGRCGIQFDEPIPVEEVQRQRHAGEHAAVYGPEELWKAAEDWSKGY